MPYFATILLNTTSKPLFHPPWFIQFTDGKEMITLFSFATSAESPHFSKCLASNFLEVVVANPHFQMVPPSDIM
ncbi:hypothetical protein ACTXT7_010845 [Hymenolepis weldensis]